MPKKPPSSPPEKARIQKRLAEAGLGSRREIEAWLSAGRIRLNGRLAKLGDVMSYHDRVTVDGKPVRLRAAQVTRLILYHKPLGEIVTRHDPEGRPTVFQNLPKLSQGRWLNIGRLDINTSGLLLFTNNGELANRILHPRFEVEREYAVRILGKANNAQLQQLTTGIELADGPARFQRIRDAGGSGVNHWYHVVLMEGRHREVRRLWEALDFTVSRLIRIRFADIALPRGLRTGQWEYFEVAQSPVLSELLRR